MSKKRIGLFKSALESLAEVEETTSSPASTEEASPADPVKTDEIQPTPVAEEPPKTDAGGSPEQAPAEVQAAIAESAEDAPEVAESTGVTTDEEPAPLTEEEQAELDNDVEVCATADIVEDVAELAVNQAELASNGESLVKAADAVDELEDLVQTTEQTGVDGESAAIVLEMAVESIFASIGLEHHTFVMEDASSGASASVSDKVAAIKSAIGRLIRALIEAIRRAIASVRDYLARVTQVANRVAKSALLLKREVRALKRDYTTEKLSNARLQRQLGVSNDVSISRAFQNLQELCVGATKSVKSGHIQYLNKIVDEFMADRDDDKLIEGLPKVLERAFDDALPNDSLDSNFDVDNVPEGGYILASNLLPGNAVGVLVVPKTTADLRVFSYSIEHAKGNVPDAQLDILSRQEMEWLLDSIRQTAGMVAAFHRDTQEMGKLESQLSSAVKRLDKDVKLATPEFRRFLQALTSIAPALAQGIHEKSFAYAMQCSSAGLRYVEASLNAHKAEAKKEAA